MQDQTGEHHRDPNQLNSDERLNSIAVCGLRGCPEDTGTCNKGRRCGGMTRLIGASVLSLSIGVLSS